MKIKRAATYILALIIVFLNCSCLGTNQTSTSQAGKRPGNAAVSPSGKDDRPTITLQYYKGRQDIEKAIFTFQCENPEVVIKSDPIEYDFKTVNAFSNKLLLDLNTGEGPDVMIYEENIFKSLYKAVSSGVFYDLNKLITADKDLDMADFFGGTIDSGVIDGSRYYVPLRTISNVFCTTDGILKKNNINIDYKHWTWKDMLQIYEQFSQNDKKAAKYLTNYPIYFSDILFSFGKPFVDYKNRKSDFNNKEVKEALKLYNKLGKCAPEYIQGSDMISDWTKGLKNNYYVMYQTYFLSPYSLLMFDRDYRNDLNGQLIIIPFPSWYGNGYQNGDTIHLYSINNKCKNKEYAYKLLKYMLSEKAQSLKEAEENKYSFSYETGYTVNRKALLRDLNTIGTDKAENIFNEYQALSAVTIDNYKFIVENCKTSIRYDIRIESLIKSAANNYIKGKLSEEAVLKKLDDEVDLFLNE